MTPARPGETPVRRGETPARPGDPAQAIDNPAPGYPRPSDRPVRVRRPGLIGPFSAAQVALVGVLAALVVAGALSLNQPILGPTATALPDPRATFFLIGPPTEGLQPGQAAPELEGDLRGRHYTLADLDGRPIRLADLRGHPVWLNFWASWCPPCQYETPVLRGVYERHRDEGLALVAVAVQETSVDDVRAYARTYGLGYTIGFDGTSAIFHTYRVFGLPTQFFIDRDGIIRSVVLGPVDVTLAERNLAPILAPRTSSGRSMTSAAAGSASSATTTRAFRRTPRASRSWRRPRRPPGSRTPTATS